MSIAFTRMTERSILTLMNIAGPVSAPAALHTGRIRILDSVVSLIPLLAAQIAAGVPVNSWESTSRDTEAP
jgi:hypothetical protein